MAKLLPIAAPAWPNLRVLTLKGLGCTDFPEVLAGALVGLTYLNLANNNFARLPAAVKLLSTLHHFDLARNWPLQLGKDDVATLAALPHLRTLNIIKSSGYWQATSERWTDMSMGTLVAIMTRLPLLKLGFWADQH